MAVVYVGDDAEESIFFSCWLLLAMMQKSSLDSVTTGAVLGSFRGKRQTDGGGRVFASISGADMIVCELEKGNSVRLVNLTMSGK